MDPAEFNACNPSCMAYAAVSTILPWFGGGILAHQQSKEVTRFYDLKPKSEIATNVFAHNATTIRNLAEIRRREDVPPVEIQYRSQPPMLMQPVPSEPFPAALGQGRKTNTTNLSNTKTISMAEKIKRRLKGQSTVGAPVQAPASSPVWNPFTRLVAEEPGAQGPGLAAILQPGSGPMTDLRGQSSTTNQSTNGGPSTFRSVGITGGQHAQETEEILTAGSATTRGLEIERPGADAKGKGKAVAIPEITTIDGRSVKVGSEAMGEVTETEVDQADTPKGKLTKMFKKDQKETEPEDTSAAKQASTGPSATTQTGRTTQTESSPIADAGKTEAPATDKSKGMFGGLFKKSQKSNNKDIVKEIQAAASSVAKLSAEATKAAEGLKLSNVPQIKVGEGPMSEEAKDEALKRYQDMLESGGSDPFTMLMSVDNFGALDAITELPPVRAHSISEDTVLIAESGSKREHDLSDDAVASTEKAAPAHALAHDRVINAEPSQRGTHRLSTDAMIPIRAAAPGHHLDADPIISGPKQLFQHELLDDKRILRSKSPQPHSLDLDQTLLAPQKKSRTHDLHSDTVLAAPQARTAHDLHSDLRVKSAEPVGGHHDLAHDVRILSPSGAVRDPHSIGDDEIIKENAVFRKSPHPDAMMPGEWAPSSSSGASDVNNPIASLNASLQTAGQALTELNHAMGPNFQAKANTAGHTPPGPISHAGRTATDGPGFWGKMFRRGGDSEIQSHAMPQGITKDDRSIEWTRSAPKS